MKKYKIFLKEHSTAETLLLLPFVIALLFSWALAVVLVVQIFVEGVKVKF